MTTAAVIRQARTLGRVAHLGESASPAGVDRIHGPVIVADLPPLTLVRISACIEAADLCRRLREWIEAS